MSTASTCAIRRAIDRTPLVEPCVLQTRNRGEIDPHRRNDRELHVYNVRRFRKINNLSFDNRKTYILIIKYYMVNINNASTCHICTRQTGARVHVAEPRGLVCHVASTWARAQNDPIFLHFLIILNI